MRFIIFLFLLAACSDGNKYEEFKKHTADTVYTTITYAHDPGKNDYRTVTAMKIIKDTFVFVSVDSMTKSKKWTRDSFYIIALLDTLRNKKGLPQLDSLHKPKINLVQMYLDTSLLIRDYNKNWKR